MDGGARHALGQVRAGLGQRLHLVLRPFISQWQALPHAVEACKPHRKQHVLCVHHGGLELGVMPTDAERQHLQLSPR